MFKQPKRKTVEQKRAENSAIVRCETGVCEANGSLYFDGVSHMTHCRYCGRIMEKDELE